MPKKKDHGARIFILASIIALMVLLIGAFAVFETMKSRRKIFELSQLDVPFLMISTRVTLLQHNESDLLNAALEQAMENDFRRAKPAIVAAREEFDRYSDEIRRLLREGRHVATATVERSSDRFDQKKLQKYQHSVLQAEQEHVRYVARSDDVFAALVRGDLPAARMLFPAAIQREAALKSVIDGVVSESEIFSEQAVRDMQQAQAETFQGLLTVTISAFAVGLWMVFLIRQVIRARRGAEEKLEHIAIHDSLTALFNRRHLMIRLDEAIHAARRHDLPLSLCMCDLDHFKQINDVYGHQAGDEALLRFAQAIRAEVRVEDIVGRYGGDEFVIVFPNTDLEEAKTVLERIRCRFEQEVFVTGRGDSFQLSATFGMADLAAYMANEKALLEAADLALYKAKDRGRNCVHVINAAVAARVLIEAH